jgi:hypothetical protein
MEVYTQQLKIEDVIEFLNEINYTVVAHLHDSNGQPLPAIETSDQGIFIRCQKVETPEKQEFDAKVAWELMKKHPAFMSITRLINSQYSSNIEMLYMTDFSLKKICLTDEDMEELVTLNEKYVKFMDRKFRNIGYREDYHSFCDELEDMEMEDEDEDELGSLDDFLF